MRWLPVWGSTSQMAARPLFLGYAILGDVAIRADGHVQLGAIRIRHQIFGPMMVDRTGREVNDFCGGGALLSATSTSPFGSTYSQRG